MSVPIDALTALVGPVEIAEDVPAQVRDRFAESVPGARVLVTTDPECEAARSRLENGARLIAGERVKGDGLVAASALMDRMWSFGGWEVAQTHESLSNYLLEETYEVLDAILAGDREALNEELGDLLLQVLFHARIAECESTAPPVDIDTIAGALVAKLCHRSHIWPANLRSRSTLRRRSGHGISERLRRSRVPRSLTALRRANPQGCWLSSM
ncbi:MazG nucleotide pyrophosphohydrolase domain-containing protein [Rhodococcus erythropolis]|uniref:MazG nucleotide pyrophosphohydrolase domain-containing protein n=1 Tax=Rhodococcus erythropolis TaxID=1833 RepID=UPI002092F14F|nr:MazG nucleotide pyrophosphohydrolase domain-containing protein [Rhodococcus erythropolis]